MQLAHWRDDVFMQATVFLMQLHARFGKHAVANKISHEAGGGAVIERVGIGPLVQLAFMHHADHIAGGKSLQLIMRHHQRCGTSSFQNAAHFMSQALTQIHIKVRKRLIEQQQLRLGSERPRQRHALLLPARQFMRHAAPRSLQPYQRQHLAHPLAPRVARQMHDAKGDVAANIHVREQSIVLKHHAHAPLLGCQHIRLAAHHLARQLDAAAAQGL